MPRATSRAKDPVGTALSLNVSAPTDPDFRPYFLSRRAASADALCLLSDTNTYPFRRVWSLSRTSSRAPLVRVRRLQAFVHARETCIPSTGEGRQQTRPVPQRIRR